MDVVGGLRQAKGGQTRTSKCRLIRLAPRVLVVDGDANNGGKLTRLKLL